MRFFLLFCIAISLFMLGFAVGTIYTQVKYPNIVAQLEEIKIG